MTILLFAALASLHAQDPPRFTEKVDVARVLIDARAIDNQARPLLGLEPVDFEVKIGGKLARVESVRWVTGALIRASDVETDVARPNRPVAGRLIVFLFQKSLERSRITGFMRMLLNLQGFLDGFTPHDRLAVLSFDSRLRLWLDFTPDVERVRQVLLHNLLFGGPAPAPETSFPSLAEALDAREMDRIGSVESALRLIAEALQPLPGAKTVVLVGHGFGRGMGGGLMDNDYRGAREALQRARASVFCLDVTDADSHTLEAGLQMVAQDTGGFYERTHLFSRRALDRLGAALSGHYALIVEKPDLKPGSHRIEVKLKKRSGSVLARSAYIE